jgi:hypothetical protein
MTASETARPQAVLYPVKAAEERVLLATAITPDEKLGIRLRFATSRLSEAAEQIREGHLPVATTLLSEFDRDIAVAQSIGVVESQEAAGPSIVSAGRQVTLLKGERNRVAAKMFVAPVEPESPDVGPRPLAVDPSKLGATQAGVVDLNQAGPLEAAATSANPLALVSQAKAVAAASASGPSLTAESRRASALSESSQLVFLLVTQVREGDGDAALATAREYASVLQSLSSSSSEVADVLRVERDTLSSAIIDAPKSTLSALSLALSCVDDALAVDPVYPARISLPGEPNADGDSTRTTADPQPLADLSAGATTAPIVPSKVVPAGRGGPIAVPTRRPQDIGQPAGLIGAPGGPITLPRPDGITATPPQSPGVGHPAGPPTLNGKPTVTASVRARAPARILAHKHVAGKQRSRITK